MNTDGTDQAPLTHNVVQELGGDWTPDGRRIVFTSPRHGFWDLYTIRPDGTGLIQLTCSLAGSLQLHQLHDQLLEELRSLR